MANKSKWIGCLLVMAVLCAAGLVMVKESGSFMEAEFILQAHRGLSEQYPENTAIAFLEAAKSKEFQAIETDIQETSDGELVLFHDSSLKKRTDAEGKIGDYTLEEVKKIRIDNASNSENYPNERIPLLSDYLEICKEYQKIPYIELKSISFEGMKKLLQILKEGGWDERRCVITTFVKEYIPQFRSLNDSYPMEFMVDKKESYEMEEIIEFLGAYPNMGFRPNAYVITKEEVELCKKNGLLIEAYGLKAGDKEMFQQLKRIGVQGVTCNDYAGLQ
ncbi:MAG: hypothetical protein HFI81_02245 [Eubacterium sp.]|jgi:glycerophosphoryl diester phosphodiesterase|nr:hypothetical protein [Eubacterium sp.]